jgi:acetyl esterase/lipase
MRFLFLALCAVFSLGSICAQTTGWQPSPGHTQIPIWPVEPPDSRPAAGPEATKTDASDLVGGKPWTYVENVTTPTMTVYAPTGTNTGAAVVVFPGGGYQILAIDLEGTEFCDWLTQKGITCVLLKYRVTDVGPYPKSGPYPESPMALEDAQRALGLVRFHAAEWHIDPHKIGVLGFSAGGHLTVAMSVHFDKRLYPAVDAADQVSCRPDFAVAIYPGHLSRSAAEYDAGFGATTFALPPPDPLSMADENLGLNPDIHASPARRRPRSCCRPRTTTSTACTTRWLITSRSRKPAFPRDAFVRAGQSRIRTAAARSFPLPHGLNWSRPGWERSA